MIIIISPVFSWIKCDISLVGKLNTAGITEDMHGLTFLYWMHLGKPCIEMKVNV